MEWHSRLEGYRCPLSILLWARSYHVIRRYRAEHVKKYRRCSAKPAAAKASG